MVLLRRLMLATVVAAAFFAGACAYAPAAFERPNGLDRRVDAISNEALMTQPATVLVDPARQGAAGRLVRMTLPGWVAAALIEAAVLAYFWSSGRAAGWRDFLRRRVRSETVVRFIFGASLAIIARVAALLPAFYLYRVERVMGLSGVLTPQWALLWIAHTVLAAIVAGLLAAFVLWLVDRTHQWYAYTILAILTACVAWSYASPFFSVERAGSAHQITGELSSLAHAALVRAGTPGVTVDQETSNSPVGQAVVVGVGPNRRVVVSDTLIAGSTPAEIVYRVVYEIEHILHTDPQFIALIEGGIIIVFSALAVVIADRIGFRRDDDPLSRLALVAALLAVLYLVAVPVRNASLRPYDMDADRFAVSVTGDKAAAVRAIVRATDQHMDEACPSMLATLFLDVHPSPSARIAAINGVPSACP